MPAQENCVILAAERLNAAAWSFTLQSEIISTTAQPGQFVHIRCGEANLLRRPISICDVGQGALRIVLEVRGRGTEWLACRQPGETLDILGPLGRGYALPESGRVLVTGGGIGVPPLLYAAKAAPGGAVAALGFRSRENAMLLGEFEALGRTMISTDDGTLGYHGFVSNVVRKLLAEENDISAVLACGPRPMLKSVAAAARDFGIPCQVSMEERMGCGVGACLVCACKMADGAYRHVCKDGPVFMAEEVDWS